MSDGEQKEWMNATDAAERIGVSRSSLSNAVKKAGGVTGLGCIDLGRQRAWNSWDIDVIRRLHCLDVPLAAAIKVAAAIRQGEFGA